MGSASRETGAAASALGAYLTTVLPAARRELRRLEPAARGEGEERRGGGGLRDPGAALEPSRGGAGDRRPAGRDRPPRHARRAGESSDRESARANRACWRRTGGGRLRGAPGPRRRRSRARAGRRALRSKASGRPTRPRTATPSARSVGRRRSTLRPIYRWWEVAAGASSSVAAHALIAAAADPAHDGRRARR